MVWQTAEKLCRHLPPPSMGCRFTVLGEIRPCRPNGWLALLLIKAGDVETNPGHTTTHKQVWLCNICRRQIYGRKPILIRCNRIKHWVHLGCSGIRLAQYTDTWTFNYKIIQLTTHICITPPHPSRPCTKLSTTTPPSPTLALPSLSGDWFITSLETTLHSIQQTYRRPLIHTILVK